MSTNSIADFLTRRAKLTQVNRIKAESSLVLSDDMEDEDNGSEDSDEDANPDRLQILKEPDAQKLVMKIFNSYVSENDFSELVMFIKDFDKLLFKYRGGKPITLEEIEDIENADNENPDSAEDKPSNDEEEESTEEVEDTDNIDLEGVLDSENSIVISSDGDFKPCNECSGGTVGWCKGKKQCAYDNASLGMALSKKQRQIALSKPARKLTVANALTNAIKSKG